MFLYVHEREKFEQLPVLETAAIIPSTIYHDGGNTCHLDNQGMELHGQPY